MIQPAEKTTLVDSVISQISAMIQSGAWPPGYRLPPERQLVESFSISRNTLREALKALCLMGVLESRQGGGNYVCLEMNQRVIAATFKFINFRDQRSIFDLLEVRRTIESRTAYLAAQKATSELIQLLKQNILKMKEYADDPNEASKYDINFHYHIAKATGNVFYEGIIKSLYPPIFSLMKETNLFRNLMSLSVDFHTRILNAFINADPDEASECMKKHVMSIQKTLFAIENKESVALKEGLI